jgi:hypothetical protein
MEKAVVAKGVFVASYFNRPEFVQVFAERFETDAAQRPGLRCLESLAGECLRGLRRTGRTAQMDVLLDRAAEWVLEARA